MKYMIKKIIKENYIYLIIIAILTILFTIIINSSISNGIDSFDYKFVNFMNSYSNDTVTLLFKFLTNFGDLYIPLFKF